MNTKVDMKIGNIIQFGKYEWRVLDVLQNSKALLLCDVIKQGSYHYNLEKNPEKVTWEQCTIRRYLNESFYNQFSPEDRARMSETCVMNYNNPWHGTNGGNNTLDKIFLLSIEETVKFFGDSGQLRNGNPKNENLIDDQYNSARIAVNTEGDISDWWLRSVGFEGDRTACVVQSGIIDISCKYFWLITELRA